MASAHGAFGLLGALAAQSDGNDLVKKNNLATPADAIAQSLYEHLQAARNMQLVAEPISVSSSEAGEIAAAANGKADYVVDVQTTGWGYVYYPNAWDRYRVQHSAKVRIIDVASKTVVAQGACSHHPSFSDSSPTRAQLVENEAAGLKSALEVIAAQCVNLVKQDILAI